MEQKRSPRPRDERKLMAQGHGSLETTYQGPSITKRIQGSSHQNMQFIVVASALMGRFLRSSEVGLGQKDRADH